MKEFVTKLFDNVPVFDTGGRAATTTFVEREIGDVLITFESETRGIAKEFGEDKFEQRHAVGQPACRVPGRRSSTRWPTSAARATSPRPISTSSTRRKARRSLAENGNRVHDEAVAAEFKDQFPDVRLVTVEDVFGGWGKVQDEHFAVRRPARPDLRRPLT